MSLGYNLWTPNWSVLTFDTSIFTALKLYQPCKVVKSSLCKKYRHWITKNIVIIILKCNKNQLSTKSQLWGRSYRTRLNRVRRDINWKRDTLPFYWVIDAIQFIMYMSCLRNSGLKHAAAHVPHTFVIRLSTLRSVC